jgi:hypothetical protein
MATPIKTCVLGVGLSGLTFHVPFVLALPELFKLHGVLERKPQEPGGKLQARFGPEAANGVKIYHTIDEVVTDPEIELVIVGTPNETHYEYTKRAIEAGKHGTFISPHGDCSRHLADRVAFILHSARRQACLHLVCRSNRACCPGRAERRRSLPLPEPPLGLRFPRAQGPSGPPPLRPLLHRYALGV